MKNYNYPASYGTLNPDQKAAFQMLVYGHDSGKHYFLTGDAGTGKTYLIDVFSTFCALNGISLVKCAPTGVAATAIHGSTMHRLFRLPLNVVTEEIQSTQFANIHRLISKADVIFIDEVSMCRIDIFGNVMRQISEADKIRTRAGKAPIQIILSGDFGQLAPIVTENDRNLYMQATGKDIGDGCCFRSHWWTELDFQPIILSQHMRQSDTRFCSALDNLRIGIAADLDYLNASSAPAPVDGGIWLCGYNRTADYKNVQGLAALPGEVRESRAVVTGKANVKQTNFAENLLYKDGARVVMCMREPGNRNSPYDNGSLGTIVGIGRDYVRIELDSGPIIPVGRVKLPFYEYVVNGSTIEPHEIGTVTQYPFKIGYAVTIHKSQGQTFDKLNLVPEIFIKGQLYVAMSRCRDVGGIYIQPDRYGRKLTPDKVMPNPEAVRFLIEQDANYADFRKYFMSSLYDPSAG